jgi:hypothetical protein
MAGGGMVGGRLLRASRIGERWLLLGLRAGARERRVRSRECLYRARPALAWIIGARLA